MRMGRSAVAVAVTLGLVLGGSTLAFTQGKSGKVERGGYPHLHAAMRALQQAENQLGKATAEIGNHRAKAMDLIKQAQKELQEGIAYAQANPPKGGGATAPGTAAPVPAATAPKPK